MATQAELKKRAEKRNPKSSGKTQYGSKTPIGRRLVNGQWTYHENVIDDEPKKTTRVSDQVEGSRHRKPTSSGYKKTGPNEFTAEPVALNDIEKEKTDDRSGFERVMDTISAPLSKPGVVLKEGLRAGSEAVAESREKIKSGDVGEAYNVVGTTVASTAVLGGLVLAGGAIAGKVSAKIAASQTARAIAAGNAQQIAAQAASGGVKTVVASTKTIATTTSWLTKIAKVAKNPAFIATSLVTAIGSYPFAGFIKEEALQTLSMGLRSALEKGDIEGAAAAIEEQRELLNPSIWDKIIGAIPMANVVGNLRDFYSAAQTKLAIDEKIFQDIQTGETEDEKWYRIAQEEIENKNKIVDYYNDERRKLIEWENKARLAQLEKEADFWRSERQKQAEKEKEDAEAMAQFWLEYRKELYRMQQDTRPSNLNFGLL